MQIITDSTTSPWFIYVWKGLFWFTTADDAWQISRIQVGAGGVSLKYTTENGVYFDSIWDNRTTYTY